MTPRTVGLGPTPITAVSAHVPGFAACHTGRKRLNRRARQPAIARHKRDERRLDGLLPGSGRADPGVCSLGTHQGQQGTDQESRDNQDYRHFDEQEAGLRRSF